jgi:hypothetical protein
MKRDTDCFLIRYTHCDFNVKFNAVHFFAKNLHIPGTVEGFLQRTLTIVNSFQFL